jgi:hypothetical protein
VGVLRRWHKRILWDRSLEAVRCRHPNTMLQAQILDAGHSDERAAKALRQGTDIDTVVTLTICTEQQLAEPTRMHDTRCSAGSELCWMKDEARQRVKGRVR